jgi:DNA polymerase III epsilon subunit family exonuclease
MPRSAFASLLALADQGEPFHIVDVETTGLSPGANRVIELATVTVKNGAIVDRFETLVDPGVEIPPFITQFTGIRPEMLEGAPTPDVAYRRWLDYLGGSGHFVAHNAEFDWGFLTYELRRAELAWPFSQKTCTVKLSRHCLPQLRSHKLENLIRHFGIQVTDRHRALADVEATATVFLNFLEHLRKGAADEPQAVEHVVPAATPEPDAWTTFLAHVKARSVTTAALLEQHAELAGQEADGAVVLRIRPVFLDRLNSEASRRSLVEDSLKNLWGDAATLRLEAL